MKKETRSKLIRILGLPIAAVAGIGHKLAHLHLPVCVSQRLTRKRVEMATGMVVMFIGVGIAKCAPEHGIVHILADVTGYSIHGLGLVPFAKVVEGVIAVE